LKVPFHFSVIKGEEDECSFAEGNWCHFEPMPKNGTFNGNLANNNGNWQIMAARKEDIDNNLPSTSFDGNPQSKLQ
jgi:hypothetical protein